MAAHKYLVASFTVAVCQRPHLGQLINCWVRRVSSIRWTKSILNDDQDGHRRGNPGKMLAVPRAKISESQEMLGFPEPSFDRCIFCDSASRTGSLKTESTEDPCIQWRTTA